MKKANIQVGVPVNYKLKKTSAQPDLHISGVVRHVDPDYIIVEHDDGSSACIDPTCIIPLKGNLSSKEVYELHDAHRTAREETRQFLQHLPYLDLADSERDQLEVFARRALRITIEDYNLLERVVKANQNLRWFKRTTLPPETIEMEKSLLGRGIQVWNFIHPDMPIAH